MSHLFSEFEEFDYESVRYSRCDKCVFNTPAAAICVYDHLKYNYETTYIGADNKTHTKIFPGRKLVDLQKCPCSNLKEKL